MAMIISMIEVVHWMQGTKSQYQEEYVIVET